MSAHGLMLDGRQVCNASVNLVAVYEDIASHELWLLMGVVLDEQFSLLWMASALDRLNLEREVPGCICVDERGRTTHRQIATFLRAQLMQPNLPRGMYLPQSGWHMLNNRHQYVTGAAAPQSIAVSTAGGTPPPWIAAPTVMQQHLAVDPKLSETAATERLMESLWRQAEIYFPIWSYTLFAVCRSFLRANGLPTGCILYLIAPQGLGKTTAAKRLCQLFDDPAGMIADVYDAGSTTTPLRDALTDARDHPVLLDDICLSTGSANQRKRRELAAQLVRYAANETPLTKKSGKQSRIQMCAASLVVTGEIPFEACSDVTRCVIVRIQHQMGGDTDELRTVAATALQGFLKWFGARYEMLCEKIRQDFDDFCDKSMCKTEPRVQKNLFILHWLLCRFIEFSADVQAIAESSQAILTKKAAQALGTVWSNIQTELRRIENRPPSITDAIGEGLQSHKLRAFRHSGCVCVRTHDLTEYLRQVYHQGDLNTKTVTSALRIGNLLSLDKSGKSTKKVDGKRYLCIPASALNYKCGGEIRQE